MRALLVHIGVSPPIILDYDWTSTDQSRWIDLGGHLCGTRRFSMRTHCEPLNHEHGRRARFEAGGRWGCDHRES